MRTPSPCGFVYRCKRANRIKLLIWDRTGMGLIHKDLDRAKLVWPQMQDRLCRVWRAEAVEEDRADLKLDGLPLGDVDQETLALRSCHATEPP